MRRDRGIGWQVPVLSGVVLLACAGPASAGEKEPKDPKTLDALPAVKDAKELSEAELMKALDEIRERQAKIKTITAKIEKDEYDALAEVTETAPGTLKVKLPGRIRRDFEGQRKSSWILNDQVLVEYLPNLKEAYRMEFGKANKGAAAMATALSMDLKGLREYFTLRGFSKDGGLVLMMAPLDPAWAKRVRHIRVDVAAGAVFMKQLQVTMAGGDKVTEKYTDIATGAELDAKLFAFVPPDGVKVTTRKLE